MHSGGSLVFSICDIYALLRCGRVRCSERQQAAQILADGHVRIGVERGGGRRARAHGGERDGGLLRGARVDDTVADVERLLTRGAEGAQRGLDALGRGLRRLDILDADDAVDEVARARLVEFLLDAAARLRGDDADARAARAQGAQHVERVGEEMRAGRHVAVGEMAVILDERVNLGGVLVARDAAHGLLHRQADGLADDIVRHLRPRIGVECQAEAFEDALLGIDQGVIEIEQVQRIAHVKSPHWLCRGAQGLRMGAWRLWYDAFYYSIGRASLA